MVVFISSMTVSDVVSTNTTMMRYTVSAISIIPPTSRTTIVLKGMFTDCWRSVSVLVKETTSV